MQKSLAETWSYIEAISLQDCKRLPQVAIGYAQSHRRLTYCCLGAVAGCFAYKFQLRKRYFAWLFDAGTGVKIEKYEAMKRDFFEALSEQVSHDAALREEHSIRILEVGVGSGTNFEFFPDGCHLVAVDPNPFFGQYYDRNRSKFQNIKSAEIIVSKGEDMDIVKSNSVDAVIMTLVMCSVSDVQQLVHQVKRVLAPGGKCYFIEHVLEWDTRNHWLRRRLQQILTTLGVWPFLFDGCHLTRDPLPIIREQGEFSDVQHEYFYAPVPGGIGKMVESHLRGVATK